MLLLGLPLVYPEFTLSVPTEIHAFVVFTLSLPLHLLILYS